MARAGMVCCPQVGLSEGWTSVSHLTGWEDVFSSGISDNLYLYGKLLVSIECIILYK